MPDIIFDSVDLVPEGLKEHAKEANGKYVVKVVPSVKLDEFRETNLTLARERDDLKKYRERLAPLIGDDVDGFASRYQELSDTDKKVKDGALKTSDAVDKEVQARVGAMKDGYERQQLTLSQELAAAKQAREASDRRYQRSIIDRSVTDAVLNDASGALPSALPDILSRASAVFSVDANGRVIAKDGDAIIYGADGATPMTPLEYLAKLRSQAPYFFKGSNGGGANGGGNQGGGPSGNHKGPLPKADFDKLKAVDRIAYARKYGMTKS